MYELTYIDEKERNLYRVGAQSSSSSICYFKCWTKDNGVLKKIVQMPNEGIALNIYGFLDKDLLDTIQKEIHTYKNR